MEACDLGMDGQMNRRSWIVGPRMCGCVEMLVRRHVRGEIHCAADTNRGHSCHQRRDCVLRLARSTSGVSAGEHKR